MWRRIACTRRPRWGAGAAISSSRVTFLVDANPPPRLALSLTEAGHHAVHVVDLALLLSELTTEQILDLVDFQYIGDALSRDEAGALLDAQVRTRGERIATLRADGYAAYTTSPGWLGYDEEKVRRLSMEAVLDGFSMIKLKVGAKWARTGTGSRWCETCSVPHFRSPSTPTNAGVSMRPSAG